MKLGHEDSSDEEVGWDDGGRGEVGEAGEGDAAHELALRTRAHSLSSASSGDPDGRW